ncbi:hypothetical protein Dimus_023147 [Dionaea muscipula]
MSANHRRDSLAASINGEGLFIRRQAGSKLRAVVQDVLFLGMIGYLLNMKGRRANSGDPEAVIMQIVSRSRGVAGTNQRKSHDHEENVAATSESSSWIANEKTCSSDNLNLLETKGRALSCRKGLTAKIWGRLKSQLALLRD